MRLSSGKGREIDVYGAAGDEKWSCQSKWVTGKKIGVDVLNELMVQADIVKEESDPQTLRMWLFAHNGLTKNAEEFANKNGIFWSSRKEFDKLLDYVGLRVLPEI